MAIKKLTPKAKPAKSQKATVPTGKKYPKLDLEDLKDKHKELRDRSGGNFLKLEGETRLRIVPFVHEDEAFLFAEFSKHYIKALKTSFNCLHDQGEECPICNLVAELQDMGASDTAGQLMARSRFHMNVLVAGELKKVEVGPGIVKDILSYITDPDYGDITDPDTGRDIKITKTGTGLSTEYEVKVVPNPSRVTFPDKIPDLIRAVKYTDSDTVETELAKVFTEIQTQAEKEVN